MKRMTAQPGRMGFSRRVADLPPVNHVHVAVIVQRHIPVSLPTWFWPSWRVVSQLGYNPIVKRCSPLRETCNWVQPMFPTTYKLDRTPRNQVDVLQNRGTPPTKK